MSPRKQAKGKKLLVIDASIARAAGPPDGAAKEVAILCRDTLTQVLEVCHRMIWTSKIGDEWKRHQSHFARKWRVRMEAKKKIVHADVDESELLDRIERKCRDAAIGAILKKDACLVAAALQADQTILSLDDRAKSHYQTQALSDPNIRRIQWINPGKGETLDPLTEGGRS